MMTLIFLHNNQMSIKYLLPKPHLKKKEFKLTEENNKKRTTLYYSLEINSETTLFFSRGTFD